MPSDSMKCLKLVVDVLASAKLRNASLRILVPTIAPVLVGYEFNTFE